MTKEKQVYSVVKEYDGFMAKIHEYVLSQIDEGDWTDIIVKDGSCWDGYWSYTDGDISIRQAIDLGAYYYNGTDMLPDSEAKTWMKDLFKVWEKEAEEEGKDIDEYVEDGEGNWAYVYLNIMLKKEPHLDSDIVEKFSESDHVLQISLYLADEYGRFVAELTPDYFVGVSKDNDLTEMFEGSLKAVIKGKLDILKDSFLVFA